MYIDIHTHLTRPEFEDDWKEVVQSALDAGLEAIVVNGLEPKSNRKILEMAAEYPCIWPALGIYPIDAVSQILPEDFKFEVVKFDPFEEIKFIQEQANLGKVKAIGECGLDGYWLREGTFKQQEAVFESLIEVSLSTKIPLIIHTRKLEKRSIEILKHHRVEHVNFHCFGGKVKLALQVATEMGWWFSIPPIAHRNEAFKRMLEKLPLDRILTETDAPFLSPDKGIRNEPKNVVGTVELLAKVRNLKVEDAAKQVKENFLRLFEFG